MDYSLLGRVMELVHLDRFYAKKSTWENRNAVYYAVKHGKVLTHWDGDNLVGYCSYGFFTRDELDKDLWNGDEVYARDTGDILYFPKFQCRHGKREVIKFIRNIQQHMFNNYPDVHTAEGLRVYPIGRTRNEKWHRKSA